MQRARFSERARPHFVERDDPLREGLERHIHTSFARVYGADVNQFLPTLIGLEGTEGEILGALGIAPGTDLHPFFLEQYLDAAVEQLLGNHLDHPVARGDIVEVGNLAAGSPGAARLMIICLTAYLHGAGFGWVVFTAVPALRNAFLRLGIHLEELAPANGKRLGPDLKRWGNYYDQQPVVVAIGVGQAFDQLRRHLEMEQALAIHELWHQALAHGIKAGGMD